MRLETKIKLSKFKPRNYQLPILDAIENKDYKRVLAILPRRAGKDITAFNLMIRQALKRVAVYYYIFPTYSQAKKVIWDAITNSGDKFLDYIPYELIKSKNGQEMKITLINGSLIQLVGSDSIDSLVGTNPYGIVFSEYALQDPRAYQFLRPILLANDGWALFISCVAPNTLIIGQKGLQRIKDVSKSREEYSDLNKPVWGLGGFHNATDFYCGGKQPTLKIALESGYELECTPVHKLWTGKEWVQSQNLKIGDELPIQYGQDVWGDGLDVTDEFIYARHGLSKEFPVGLDSEDFFYLLGLIHADGNYSKDAICVTNKKDPDIIEFLHSLGFKTRPDGIHHNFSSREFCELLEFLGFKHGATNKTFPDKLFDCTRRQMKHFIRGLFDGDGCSASNPSKRGYVKLTSTCKPFMNDLQVVLLNFGIVSSLRHEDKLPTKKVNAYSRIYNLEIYGHFAHVFYRDIGFRLERKQRNWEHVPESCRQETGNIYQIDVSRLDGYSLPKNIVTNPNRISRRMIQKLNHRKPNSYLSELLQEKFFYSKIKSIQPALNEVFDFVIPETHSFFNNGYIGHNTPRGKNHMWELYQIAKESPSWFAYKLTVEDTLHIPLREIEKERAEGLMSDDLIQQEYFTSFDMGVEGAYYAKYLDRMRVNNQIGTVPWEVAFKVHTAWDLGVRDSTAIIFFQTVGQTIRIIDCYEKSKEGLEHYVKIINSKPYTYGKHIGPHDIRVREFGSGITRIEKARQLGINFTVAENIAVPDGIEAVRSSLGRMYIDSVNCSKLVKALENYRQEYDMKRRAYKQRPLHDWSSHFCFAGDTSIATESGDVHIRDIRVGAKVKTPFGYRKVLKVHKREVNRLCVVSVNGTKTVCTPGHSYFTNKGLMGASSLREGVMLESNTRFKSWIWKRLKLYISLFKKEDFGFKDFLKDVHFNARSTLMCSVIEEMERKMFSRGFSYSNSFLAPIKRKLLDLWMRTNLKLFLLFVRFCLFFVDIFSQKEVVTGIFIFHTYRPRTVYDLTVETDHCYYANGYLVSNSDAMRYLAVSLPKTRDGLTPEELDKRYQDAVYGHNSNMPSIFRDDLPPY